MTGAVLGTAVLGTLPHPTAAHAATPQLRSLIAYVRNGDIHISRGPAETRLTTGGGHSRPRWSPDGRRIAYLKGDQLWTMNADGTAQRRLGTRAASGPSWSPDGKWIAFASLSCSGGPGVYRIPATTAATAGAAGATPEVLFPRDCRGEAPPAQSAPQALPAQSAPQALPAQSAPTSMRAASLAERLRTDDAVAWSPDGAKIAFRGGDCESVYDACLSVGTVATGAEQTVAAYGGGSLQNRGFAVVPSWRSDGARLAWTAYQQGETAAQNEPVHLVEYDPATRAKHTIGGVLDRELAYLDADRGVVTGQNGGGSWVVIVRLAGGARTLFHAGSQPSVQPTR